MDEKWFIEDGSEWLDENRGPSSQAHFVEEVTLTKSQGTKSSTHDIGPATGLTGDDGRDTGFDSISERGWL
jgi:hypothetical protein